MSELPAVITELRRAWLASGETLACISQRMGDCSISNVSASLNGTSDIRLSRLIRLADALGYDLALVPLEERA